MKWKYKKTNYECFKMKYEYLEFKLFTNIPNAFWILIVHFSVSMISFFNIDNSLFNLH